MIYVVKQGDTVDSIAAEYGISLERLAYDNQIYSPYALAIGQALLVQIPEEVYQVQEGDTLAVIAQNFGTTERQLIRNNLFLFRQPGLTTGQWIVIRYQDQRENETRLNGYAYPYINQNVLEETLYYLTSVSVFSYGFTAEGDLIPDTGERIVETALGLEVQPILVLTPLDENGNFNNYLVSAVVNDAQVQEKLIAQLITEVERRGYQGVDIDFEYILPEDRVAYAEFVANVREAMQPLGIPVSVALAPKTSADQVGLLYEGMDYRLLGEAADSVLLMTYEWGYT